MTSSPPDNPSTSNLRKRLFIGLRWTGSSQVVQQILNLGSSIVLARLLAPQDFGLLAMASVFTGVVFIVLDLGLGSAIVQTKDLEERQISSVFWMNVLVGLVMTVLVILLSWPIAAFYNSPRVQPIIVGLSLNFFVFSLGSTQQALLTRRMNFRSLELRTLGGHLAGTICGVALAFWGYGVWSLVARILITGLVGMILLWSVSGWRPSWSFCWADVRPLVGFSNDVLAANLLGYVGTNADNLLIGRFVGVNDLGYYALAYHIMRLPVQRFSQVLVKVLFPALSRLQEDLEKVKRSWFRAARLTGAVTIPMMSGLIALAPQLIPVVYGEQWLPAVPVLQVLCVIGAVQSITIINSSVLLALGKSRLRLKLIFLSIAFALASFVVGLPFGIMGVATSFTIVNTATSAYMLIKTLECVNSNFGEYFHNLAGVLAATGGMTLVVLAIAQGLPLAVPLILVLAIPAGCIVYLLLLRWVAREILQEAWNILPERFTKRWLKIR